MPETRSIERVCETCGKSFLAFPHKVKIGGAKYCSNTCSAEARRDRVETTCLQCGKIFKTIPAKLKMGLSKFCSTACWDASRRKRILCTCLECGKEFTTIPAEIRRGGGKYCSQECYNAPRKQIKAICETCGKPFALYPSNLSRAQRRYCSLECAGRVPKETQCQVCGKSFRVYPRTMARGQGKYCSMECYGTTIAGSNSRFWRGGTYLKFGHNWKEQRKVAYKRDSGVCQYCGLTEEQALKKYGKRNSIHHIIKRRTFRERGENIENANFAKNLLTLCCSCHRRAENGSILLQPKLL